MNAFIREKYEVPVAKRETIEAQIEPLRTGLSEVRTDVRELRADNKTLRDKIDALRDRMDEGFRASDAKIDSVNKSLGEKITKLSDDVAGMRGLQKAMLWVMGGVGSLATVLLTVGKALHWF